MDEAAWWMLALGCTFIVVIVVFAGQVRANRRNEQERLLVEAHRSRVRIPEASSKPPEVVAEPEPLPVDTFTGTAYCMKCRAKRDFTGPIGLSAKGSRVAHGICPVCGTKMTRILPKGGTTQ